MNYNTLMNKPTINYSELIGDNTVTEVGGITEEQFNTLLSTDLSSYYTKAQIDDLFSRSYVYREKSGSIVTFDCPSTPQSIPSLTVGIEPVQSGSGDPSPTNVRPFSGWSVVNMYDGPTTDPQDATVYTTTLKDANDQPLTCYGGALSNENGVQSLTADATENQKVKLSDLTWTYQSSNERFYCDTPITVKRPSSNTELPVYFGCECYKAVPYSSYTNGNITITSSGSMFVKDSNYTDTTTWLNAVGNNNILLPLATPQQIPQDNLAISTQDGTNNIWADTGDVISGEYFSKL